MTTAQVLFVDFTIWTVEIAVAAVTIFKAGKFGFKIFRGVIYAGN